MSRSIAPEPAPPAASSCSKICAPRRRARDAHPHGREAGAARAWRGAEEARRPARSRRRRAHLHEQERRRVRDVGELAAHIGTNGCEQAVQESGHLIHRVRLLEQPARPQRARGAARARSARAERRAARRGGGRTHRDSLSSLNSAATSLIAASRLRRRNARYSRTDCWPAAVRDDMLLARSRFQTGLQPDVSVQSGHGRERGGHAVPASRAADAIAVAAQRRALAQRMVVGRPDRRRRGAPRHR